MAIFQKNFDYCKLKYKIEGDYILSSYFKSFQTFQIKKKKIDAAVSTMFIDFSWFII